MNHILLSSCLSMSNSWLDSHTWFNFYTKFGIDMFVHARCIRLIIILQKLLEKNTNLLY